jgi:hypothetical protein
MPGLPAPKSTPGKDGDSRNISSALQHGGNDADDPSSADDEPGAKIFQIVGDTEVGRATEAYGITSV